MKNIFKSLIKLNILSILSLSYLFISLPARADVALWKLSDEDTTIYLMGTIHILPKGTVWQTATVKEAFESSDTVILEIHPDNMTPAAMQPLIVQYGVLPEGQTLDQVLDAGTYAKVKAMFGATPAWAQMQKLRPWLISVMISAQATQANGYDVNSGVEKVLERLARASGKSFGGLEAAEVQVKALSSLGKAAKSGLLDDMLDNLPQIAADVETLRKLWIAGDVEALGQFIHKDMADYPEAYAALLTNRNKNWVVKLDQLLAKPGTKFVAVGAGHLAGKDSVITMLKSMKMKVERVQ